MHSAKDLLDRRSKTQRVNPECLTLFQLAALRRLEGKRPQFHVLPAIPLALCLKPCYELCKVIAIVHERLKMI
jgi:hypothetical protein